MKFSYRWMSKACIPMKSDISEEKPGFWLFGCGTSEGGGGWRKRPTFVPLFQRWKAVTLIYIFGCINFLRKKRKSSEKWARIQSLCAK